MDYTLKQKEENEMIIHTLSNSDWHLTEKGEIVHLAELSFSNKNLTIEVEYEHSDSSITLRIFTKSKELFLAVYFEDKLKEILSFIVGKQENLSAENYQEFVKGLLKITPLVFLDNGEDLIQLVDDSIV